MALMSSDRPEASLGHPRLFDRLVESRLTKKRRRELVRFVKFGVVGTVGAVVDFGSFNILIIAGWLASALIRLPFGLTITETGVAATIAFMLAVTNNFLWNRYWTYPDSRSKPIASQYLIFMLINGFGLLIRLPLVEILPGPISQLLINLLNVGLHFAEIMSKNLALATALVIALFWNFFVNRYITYGDVE